MWQNKSRPNKTAKIPYAYKADADDPLVLIPDPDIVPLVEQAMDYLDEGHSSRRTADWLSEKSGKTISHQGLSNMTRHSMNGSQCNQDISKMLYTKTTLTLMPPLGLLTFINPILAVEKLQTKSQRQPQSDEPPAQPQASKAKRSSAKAKSPK